MAIRRPSNAYQASSMPQRQSEVQESGTTAAAAVSNPPLVDNDSNHASTAPSRTRTRTAVLMEMNTQALTHFWEGREEESLSILKRCIALLEQTLSQHSATELDVPTYNRVSLTPLSLDEVLSPIDGEFSDEEMDDEEDDEWMEHDMILSSVSKDSNMDNNKNYSNNALEATTLPDLVPCVYLVDYACSSSVLYDSIQDMRTVCTVMCYNVAILRHCMAIVRATPHPASSLTVAQHYYREALGLWNANSIAVTRSSFHVHDISDVDDEDSRNNDAWKEFGQTLCQNATCAALLGALFSRRSCPTLFSSPIQTTCMY